jgi:hypothetical protein
MHSNGGRGLVFEAMPAVGESRRGGHPAALSRRRSSGGAGLIVGACGESLRAVSAMGSFRAWLFVLRPSHFVAGASAPSERSGITVASSQ